MATIQQTTTLNIHGENTSVTHTIAKHEATPEYIQHVQTTENLRLTCISIDSNNNLTLTFI